MVVLLGAALATSALVVHGGMHVEGALSILARARRQGGRRWGRRCRITNNVVQKLFAHGTMAVPLLLALVTAKAMLVLNTMLEELAAITVAGPALLAIVVMLVLARLAGLTAHTPVILSGMLGQHAALGHALSHHHLDRFVLG